MESVNRFDRIVAILVQLQNKRVVKAQELADRFQISLRTVYRDIRSLETAGVPIVSEAGVGYSIMEGYRLPPVMFTQEEAASFVAAQKLMQNFTDKTLGKHYETAMYKIKSVLRGKEKDWVESLEKHIRFFPTQEIFNPNVANAMEIILSSIAEQQQVFLKYTSLQIDHAVDRVIEPVGIFNENNFWYVLAYCHLRKDYRQFRTDRIQAIKRTEIPYEKKHSSLEELRSKDTRTKLKVKIIVDKTIAKFLGNKKNYGLIDEKSVAKGIEMTFLVDDLDNGFARWYLMYGDFAQILEPPELKERMRHLLNKQLNQLKNSTV